MKVVKSGMVPRNKVYQATCKRCGCIFEFSRMEARYVEDNRDGDAVVIPCPECDEENWITA
jgi:RNase P subunit RPR2